LYPLIKVFGAVVIVTLVVLLLKWLWSNYVPIEYAKISTSISSLNAPNFLKEILLFGVHYNIYLFLCACFGASVGAAEILSRYKDEPFIAIVSPPGCRYLALNAGMSLAAFYLLYHFRETISIVDPLSMSVVAGFGAMVVMRSKLFNFKTDKGETYAVGPDAVLSTFLTSVDRQIDRYRASRRQDLVYAETQSISDPQSAPEFLKTFLVSYQNLSNDERAFVDSEIKRIYEGTEFKSPRLKFMVIAFGFLNIMGEKNFKALIDQLKKYQSLGTPTPTTPTPTTPTPTTPAPTTPTPTTPAPTTPAPVTPASTTPAPTTPPPDASDKNGSSSTTPTAKDEDKDIAP
ncbi:MAG TPA: hypothetical protein VJS64_15845, partial [Pyrinomonadaceae bacterium]|nr:hypothetical protein [Pyrinomonadaceae bacterium]